MEPLSWMAAIVGISFVLSIHGQDNTKTSGNITLICPTGWILWETNCYLKVSSEMKLDDIQGVCKLYQSSSLEIDDEIENIALTLMADPWTIFWSGQRIKDPCLGYWDAGEPPSDISAGDCAAIQNNGRWKSVSCYTPLPFFCEKPACVNGTFDCGDGNCVNTKWKCDGFNDCGNNLDEMDCSDLCTYRKFGATGSITYNNKNANDSDCTWTIISPPGTQLAITFQSINLEEPVDILEVRGGGQIMSDSSVLETLTGKHAGKIVYTTNNMAILRLLSDFSGTTSEFVLKWTSFSSVRNITVDVSWKQVSSPFYPSTPSRMFFSEWLISSPEDTIITITVQNVNLVGDWKLIAYNGETYRDIIIMASSPSDLTSPYIYFSTVNKMRIILKGANIARDGQGILLRAKAGCDVDVPAFSGIITSPGFLLKTYPSSTICTWVIKDPLERGRKLTVKFLSFQLQTTGSFVQIFNGVDDTAPALHNGLGYTGNLLSSLPVVQGGDTLYIKFVSSPYQEEGGFNFEISMDCPRIPDSVHLLKTGSSTSIGAHVRLECLAGYSFVQEEYYLDSYVDLTCLKTGQWNKPRIPSCQIIHCGAPPPVYSGFVKNYSGFLTYGNKANYQCYTGFHMSGNAEVTCQNTGQWSLPPVCTTVSAVVSCGEPPNVENAEIRFITPYGVIVEYICHEGFEIIGTSRRLCQANGLWSDSAFGPVCRKKRCPITRIPHGNWNVVDPVGYQTVVQLTCYLGYVASNTRQRTAVVACRSDGTFEDITCEDENECNRPGSVCSSIQACVNTDGSYSCTCNPGYRKNMALMCEDINECTDGTHRCEHICTNVQGSYVCSCRSGFQLSQNGSNFPCDEINPSAGVSGEDVRCPMLTPRGTEVEKSKVMGIYPSRPTSIREKVVIECSLEDGSTVNKTLFCANNKTTHTYELQGDNPVCQVVDCGPPGDNTGQHKPVLTSTTFGSSFTFTCIPGATLSGMSTSSDNAVRCLANWRWGYGNLTCIVASCSDPGTPAGTIQKFDSYMVGKEVAYGCIRPGYTPSVAGNLTCILQDGPEWDRQPPTCTDTAPPVFPECDGVQSITVDKMEAPNIAIHAEDNSGFVITDSAGFQSSDPILADKTVTYTAIDGDGNHAVCRYVISLKDRTPGTLTCPETVTYKVTTAIAATYNIVDQLTYVGGQLTSSPKVNVSLDTVGSVMDFRITLRTEAGTESSCAFQVQIHAAICFPQLAKEPNHARKTRVVNTDSVTTLEIACINGYEFADGTLSRIYTCTGENIWTPPLPLEDCIGVTYKYSYEIRLTLTTVDYLFADDHCRTTIQDIFNNSLSPSTSLINNLCRRGVQNTADVYYRFSVIQAAIDPPFVFFSHRVSMTLKFENYDGNTTSLDTCLKNISEKKGELFAINTESCTFSVAEIRSNNTVAGGTCGTGYRDIGADNACLPCPQGKFLSVDGTCQECPDGQYQDLAGKTACKPCGNNMASLSPRIGIERCVGKCENGFYSASGLQPCIACPVDFYWSSNTFCAPCPNGGSTLYVEGVADITACRDPCDVGHYSITGYAPCSPCPRHYYQDQTSQSYCKECPTDSVTENTGSIYSTDCKKAESVFGPCSDECYPLGTLSCEFNFHRLNCSCKPGYAGDACERVLHYCSSQPCYNGGRCNSDTNGYFCACPSGFTGTHCETDLVDNCNNIDCGINGVCRDMVGFYECVCPESKKTNEWCDGHSNICSPNACKNGASCTSWSGVRFQCTCLPGYTGSKCETTVDNCLMNPSGCLYGGTCVNGVASYTCVCPPGMTGAHCETETVVCSSGVCDNGVCSEGTPVCVCNNTFQNDANGYCTYNYCSTDPCGTGGYRCHTVTNGYRCVCKDGYEGARCQFTTDNCVSNPCVSGSCINGINNFTCKCHDGWTGKTCYININDCLGYCSSSTTETCIDLVSDYQCKCKPGYTGKNCTDDINECYSLPCQHNGTCTNGLADYTCQCMEGWQGKNCENIKNTCGENSCLNGGICYPVYNNHYCSCNKGTHGQRCELAPVMCNEVQLCTAQGKCQQFNGTASCTCNSCFSGVSCELIEDACSKGVCKNGATCSLERPTGYSCQCAEGFTGQNCGSVVNACPDTCPDGTRCMKEGSQTFCVCPPKQIINGTSCKTASSNFDLFLNGGLDTDMVRSSVPFRISGDMSVMVWIGYFSSGRSVLINNLNADSIYFELFHDDIHSYVGSVNVSLAFGKLIAGQWNHVTVTWADNRTITVYIDGILVSQKIFTSDFVLPENLLFVSIDPNFTGYISHLTVWKAVLTLSDIQTAANYINFNPSKELALAWTHYRLNGGSKIYSPSRAGLSVTLCDAGRVKVPTCPGLPVKKMPILKSCLASDILFSTSKRVVSPTEVFVLPTADSADSVYTTLTDTFMTWGRYDVVYAFKDSDENYGICRFKVYIRGSNPCATDGFQNTTSCGGHLNSIRYFCPNNQLPSIPTPNILQCGKLGSYNLTNPSSLHTPPPCGAATDVNVSAELTLRYTMALPCTDFSKNTIIEMVKNAFINLIPTAWDGLCYRNCTNMQISALCEANSVLVTATFKDISEELRKSDGSIKVSSAEILRVISTRSIQLEFPSIGVLQKDQVVVHMKRSCNGTAGLTKCVACGPGSYFHSPMEGCKLCPVGTYSDVSSLSTCKSCGTNTTWMPGSISASNCVTSCPVGNMFDLNNNRCTECSIGFYQNLTGQFFCYPCPADNTTAMSASSSIDDCTVTNETTLSGTTSASSNRPETSTLPGTTNSYFGNLDMTTIIAGAATGSGILLIVGISVCIYRKRRKRVQREIVDQAPPVPQHNVYEEIPDSSVSTLRDVYLTPYHPSNGDHTPYPGPNISSDHDYAHLDKSRGVDNSYLRVRKGGGAVHGWGKKVTRRTALPLSKDSMENVNEIRTKYHGRDDSPGKIFARSRDVKEWRTDQGQELHEMRHNVMRRPTRGHFRPQFKYATTPSYRM